MDRTRVIFDCPASPWLVVALASVVVAGVAVLVIWNVARLARVPRSTIAALTVVAALMLTALVLNPKLIRSWPDPRKPRCVVLVDGSRSVLLDDPYGKETAAFLRDREGKARTGAKRKWQRQEVVRLLLDHGPDGWLSALGRRFELSGYRFARAVEGLSLEAGAPPFTVDPAGYATALGEALESVAGSSEGVRPAAIVLVSDGVSNAGDDPSEVARVVGRLGTPIFAVGLGDPDPPRDVSVLALEGPKTALLGDEVVLVAKIAATGMRAPRLSVELTADGQPIARKEIVAPASGRPLSVTFTHVPKLPGHVSYSVGVSPVEGEQDKDNNVAGTVVEMTERKIKALLVDAEPRWEFRFLRNVLERDPAVEPVICLLRPGVGAIAGEGYATQLPIEKKDLIPYDLVVLGDVPRRLLPDAFLTIVADMVRLRSGALVVMAGRRGHYRELAGTALEPLLPVSVADAVGTDRSGVPFSVELTQEGATHLVTRLAASVEENELVWARLPKARWSAGVGELRPGALALVVHPFRLAGAGKMPLVAVGRVGGGKVLFVGLEETWRWRKSVGDRYHYRFWAQALRWLAKKRFTKGDPHARLSIDRTDCEVGEQVEVEAYCLAPDGFPLEKAHVRLAVERDGAPPQRLVMQPAPGGWGIYRVRFTPDEPGTYTMRPIVSTYGSEPLESVETLEVRESDLERVFLAQDRQTLEAIAAAADGKVLAPHQVEELPSLLAAKVGRRLLTAELSPCRHWAFYVVLAIVLASAWLIRKRSGLA